MSRSSNIRDMNALAWLRAEQARVFNTLISGAVLQRPRLLRPALLSSTSARAITADFIARRRLSKASRR